MSADRRTSPLEDAPLRLSTIKRRSSLRLRVALAILFVGMVPQLLVLAWSQVDRGVLGQSWTRVRDASAEAARLVETGSDLHEAELRALARRAKVRLRVADERGTTLFDEDASDADEQLAGIESFFLGDGDGNTHGATLRRLDDTFGPLVLRPEVIAAKKDGPYVACDYLPLLYCQAAHAAAGGRVVHVQASSRRAVLAVYELRHQLMRLSLITLPLALVLAYTTSRRVLRPIERLQRQALERATAARGGVMLASEKQDEVAVLADAFNALLVALEEKSAENQAFAADLVHELKNPIAAVRAAAEALQRGQMDDARREGLARVLHGSTLKLDELATQFLELARAEAGMPNEERSSVDLAVLLGGLVERMRDDPRYARVTFSMVHEGTRSALVLGVDHRLDALFRELLENGASFAGDDGRVVVVVQTREDGVVVAVKDTGPGIAPGDLPNVFQRFFTTRGRQRGTGLGLALVHAVVHAHDGTIAVRSEAGAGTVFEVRFPRR